MLTYPNIDPVILHIYGNLAIRWYSLAYIFGFLLCYWWLKYKSKKELLLSNENCDRIISWIICGIIIGARIFDCLFYNFSQTLHEPLSVFRVWEGGMSFHGGMIGLLLTLFLFTKKYTISFFKLLDNIVIIAPIALFFGRIANFINAELYGNITYTSPFRMIFPTDNTQQPRHPSQLYEAFSEGICTFIIMLFLYRKTNFIKKTGLLTGCFGILYSISRFICEFFRRPEIENFYNLTAGQWLSILMLFSSLIIIGINHHSVLKKK